MCGPALHAAGAARPGSRGRPRSDLRCRATPRGDLPAPVLAPLSTKLHVQVLKTVPGRVRPSEEAAAEGGPGRQAAGRRGCAPLEEQARRAGGALPGAPGVVHARPRLGRKAAQLRDRRSN